jgi:hypothetical protein
VVSRAALALAVPPCLAIACLLTVAIGERGGATVFGAVPPANLAEAAATARGDDVVRRLALGEDRFRVYPLRPEAISSTVLFATPIEAAMWSKQLMMIHLLDRGGAIRDAAHRQEMACLAADLDAGDIVEYLSPAGTPDCVRDEARRRVVARTTGATP